MQDSTARRQPYRLQQPRLTLRPLQHVNEVLTPGPRQLRGPRKLGQLCAHHSSRSVSSRATAIVSNAAACTAHGSTAMAARVRDGWRSACLEGQIILPVVGDPPQLCRELFPPHFALGVLVVLGLRHPLARVRHVPGGTRAVGRCEDAVRGLLFP